MKVCVCVLSTPTDRADDAEPSDPGCAAGEAGRIERLSIRVHGEVSNLVSAPLYGLVHPLLHLSDCISPPGLFQGKRKSKQFTLH